MRFLAIALFFAAAASCCLAYTYEELMEKATDLGAPFTKPAVQKLQNTNAWGAQRANRTTDVAIMNKSGKDFQVIFQQCSSGRISSDLEPENRLKSRTSTVYGMDSSKPKQGVQCTLVWDDSKGSYFTVILDNPFYAADNLGYVNSSNDLKLKPTLGNGNNNQVIIIVEESGSMSMLRSSPSHSGSSRQQRGGRNVAIKASKSGSRYRTL